MSNLYDLEDDDIKINKEYTLTCPYGEDHTHHYKTVCYCRNEDEKVVIVEIDMFSNHYIPCIIHIKSHILGCILF